jgi:signal transduction histidine kinase
LISPGHRRELNRSLHELRRPLQALLLMEDAAGAASSAAARRGLLELAGCALVELDSALNGGSAQTESREVSCRELVLASVERWRSPAARRGGIRLYWDAGAALVHGQPARMAQAFDNLIANAVEHGGPPLVVTGASVAGRLRVTVANGRVGGRGRAEGAGRPGRDPRRGHGVEIVSEVAAAHRGRFALCETDSGCVAALELPLADPGLARAA